MKELSNEELKQIHGGGAGIALLIGAGVVFLIGVIDGYVRPLACRKKERSEKHDNNER